MNCKICTFLGMVCLCYGMALGHAKADELTLAEALKRADMHHPALRVQLAATQATEAAKDTAGAYPNPEIELATGKFTAVNARLGPTPSHAQYLAISQPLEWPSVRHARMSQADASLKASESQLDLVRIELHSRVRLAFFEALRRREETDVTREMLELLIQIRDRVRMKVEVGEVPRYELIKAEAETLSAANSQKNAQLRLQQARTVLRSLIGGEALPENFGVATEPSIPPQPASLPELRQQMLERHPQLQAAAAEKSRAESRLALERNLRLPQPTLRVVSQRDPEARLWLAGVSFPLPLWDRRSGPIGEASAQLAQSEAEAERQSLLLQAELEQAYQRYQMARSLVETFESGLLRESESALKTAEAAYRYGERSILDYLDAQRAHRTVKLDFIAARYDLMAAWIDIERLTATP